ncbi:MAG: hypothetical protein KF819_00495 [Labilithrix sp.]|nr:hypothetical protein [Labilithrix sp.]
MRALHFAAAFATAALIVSCQTPETAHRDKIRGARIKCDKRDGAACLAAGNLLAVDGPNADALKAWTKGCALRHAGSCDALWMVKGPLREQALVDGCNAGDLLSCVRRAGAFPTDGQGLGQARALRQKACTTAKDLQAGTPARDVQAAGEGCASLAKMVAEGKGGGRDDTAALKLEVLAMTLRAEALYRYARDEDAAPDTMIPPDPPPVEKKGRGGRRVAAAPAPTVSAEERAKERSELETTRFVRDAWITFVQSGIATSQREALRGDPSMPTPSAVEQVSATLSSAAPSKCQQCVDGCGDIGRCAGDEFAGGRCGHLRCPGGGACPPFDSCVVECTAKAETCVKACGDCAADPNMKAVK